MPTTPPRRPIRQEGGSARRSPVRSVALAALSLGLVTAAVVGATPLLGGFTPRSLPSFSPDETSATDLYNHVSFHRSRRTALIADQKRARDCRRPAYRAANPTGCPATVRYSRKAPLAKGQRRAHGPSEDGQWDAGPTNPNRPSPYLAPNFAINLVQLANGKMLFLSKPTSNNDGPDDKGSAHVWDPATGEDRSVPPPVPEARPAPVEAPGPVNLFCAGHVALPDGRIVVAGGEISDGGNGHLIQGHYGLWTFNPYANGGWGSWTRQPSMRHGRWYPTLTYVPADATYPQGRVLILGGLDEFGDPAATGLEGNNPDVEVFTPGAGLDSVGSLQRFGEINPMEQYPRTVLLPNGKILFGAPRNAPLIIDPANNWARSSLPPFSNLPGTAGNYYGNWSTFLLRPFEPGATETDYWLTGGTAELPTSGSRHVLRIPTGNTAGGFSAPTGLRVNQPRAHHTTVPLPDRSMILIGGGLGNDPSPTGAGLYAGPNFVPEIYSPQTNSWRLGPPQAYERTYHSTAALLPDGRVLSAGDDRPIRRDDPDKWRIDYYSPAYLFKGPRPVISNAPASVANGQAFAVQTPSVATVERGVLMGLASGTHGVDVGQRAIELPLSKSGGSVFLTVPTNRNIAIPGHYMLFLVNASGVPSVARMIKIDPAAPPQITPPTASFTASTDRPLVGTTVQFTDASTAAPGTTITSRSWDLNGDGAFDDGIGTTVVFTYLVPGSVQVRLRVIDSNGISNIKALTLRVVKAPSAAIAGPGQPVSIGQAFDLKDASTDDGQIVAWAWDTDGDGDYDDGTAATKALSFPASGTFPVALRVTDDTGLTATATSQVVVAPNVTVAAAPARPTIRRLRISPVKIRPGRRVVVLVNLNVAARLTITVRRNGAPGLSQLLRVRGRAGENRIVIPARVFAKAKPTDRYRFSVSPTGGTKKRILVGIRPTARP